MPPVVRERTVQAEPRLCGSWLDVMFDDRVFENAVMRRRVSVWMACVVGMVSAGAPVAGVSAELPSSGAAALTLVPAERLADPAGWADELAAQRRELESAVAQAAVGLDRAQAHLALANWVLGVPAARAATRLLLGLSLSADARTLADAGEEARQQIELARGALSGGGDEAGSAAPGSDGEQAAAARRRLETALENLEPLAALFATEAEPDADAQALWSRAARGLAVLREAADAEVASCAMLWQAYAWLQAGRQDRARALLPRPLRQPDLTTYGYMSRLLACRMVGDEGHYTAASALAIRVRAACAGWFPGESAAETGARQRLAALLQISLGQHWLKELREADQADRAAQLERILSEVQSALFAEPSLPVHRLPYAVPMLVQPPAPKPRAESLIPRREPPVSPATAPATPTTTTAPADAPASTTEPADGA